MLSAIEGIQVGHWTDSDAATGCTVVLLPKGNVTSGEVRGGAPATRDFELLHPDRLLTQVDAVLLSGGSAFGLAAADGVSRFCEQAGRGFETAGGPVPIVVAMALFDLGVGDASVRPGPEQGFEAAAAAASSTRTETGTDQSGPRGAGTGATFGKWRGREHTRRGGLGCSVAHVGELSVSAMFAVNAAGDVNDRSTQEAILRGGFEPPDLSDEARFENTTIGVVATNASLTKNECNLLAQSGHDGMARALFPAHTLGDGDAVVATATCAVEAHVSLVRLIGAAVVEEAIRSAALL